MESIKAIIIFFLSIFLLESFSDTKKEEVRMQLEAFNPMQLIKQENKVKGNSIARIKAAKNEYESFQICITANSGKLNNVKVNISDLKSKRGIIEKENITLFREEYVPIRNSSPRVSYPPGLYPDPLLPIKNPITKKAIEPLHFNDWGKSNKLVGAKYSAYPIEIFQGQNRVIWVDVYIPKNIPAGIYYGKFKAVADGNISAEIPIELTVWNFTLPDTASHSTHFGHFGRIAGYWKIKSDSKKYREIEKRFCYELAKHRINPPIPGYLLPKVNNDGSLTIIPERHEKLKQYIKETHLLDFEIPRARFMTSTSNSSLPTPKNQYDHTAIEKTKQYYSEYYNYLKQNGWEKRAYLYLLDEPNSVKDYNQVINLGKVVKDAAPELKCLVVEQTYKHKPFWPEIDDYVDIWCPLFSYIERSTINKKLRKGDRVWSYTALVQPPPNYHPNYEKVKDENPPYWHIDRPTIVYRIPLWINKQYNITGLLYWTTVQWRENPYNEPYLGPYPIRYINGGGMLFYPGKDAGFEGPVASIRLKILREGLEDYEYFSILENMGGHKFVKEIIDSISPNWWNYMRDPEVLLRARERLAKKIIELQKN